MDWLFKVDWTENDNGFFNEMQQDVRANYLQHILTDTKGNMLTPKLQKCSIMLIGQHGKTFGKLCQNGVVHLFCRENSAAKDF